MANWYRVQKKWHCFLHVFTNIDSARSAAYHHDLLVVGKVTWALIPCSMNLMSGNSCNNCLDKDNADNMMRTMQTTTAMRMTWLMTMVVATMTLASVNR